MKDHKDPQEKGGRGNFKFTANQPGCDLRVRRRPPLDRVAGILYSPRHTLFRVKVGYDSPRSTYLRSEARLAASPTTCALN